MAVIGPGRFTEDIIVSSNGEYLVVAASNGVLFYDPGSGDMVDFYLTSSGTIDMAISPDGQQVATASLDGSVRL